MLHKLHILLPVHDKFLFLQCQLLSIFFHFVFCLFGSFLLSSWWAWSEVYWFLSTLSENPLLVLQVTFWGLSGVLFSPPECFQSEVVWILVCRNQGYGGPALFFNFCFLSSSLLMGADWNLSLITSHLKELILFSMILYSWLCVQE